ncbi:MAG: DUF58 domain-containing protein [Candidatus Palauibacterales bacterium]|nr:DUF58 domain-containing protein [Candidatus Palauibacterales bacterium]MDP2482972.1 DUF58 domain-containing protein [Candidatus Palauibacterales bacterium]
MPFRLFRRRRPERDPSPDASALAALVRRLELRARRLMENRAVGAYDSVFRGHGIEFSEVRAYQPGDPFQAIDWKVTARMGKPFIKKFVEERELTVLLAVDLSGSTDFGTRVRTKRDLSLELAALLGLAAARNNDRVGLLLFTDRVERWLTPRRGRGRLRQLLHVMASHRPEGKRTDIGLALATAVRSLKTRSLVFVLSDFQGPDFRKELTAASRKHDVVGLHLVDPGERSLPAVGLIEVRDPETGAVGVLDLKDSRTRSGLARLAAAREQRVEDTFRRAGADRLVLETDRSYAADLAAFFAGRARARLH